MQIKFFQNFIDFFRCKNYSKLKESALYFQQNVGINSYIIEYIINNNFLFRELLYKHDKKMLQIYLNTIDPKIIPPATGKLRQAQLKLLDFAIFLTQELEKNNIHPILGGGSLIGAVRNQGFLPWDDDIDFDLLKDDWNRFIEYISKKYIYLDNKDIISSDEHYHKLDLILSKNKNKIIFTHKPTCISAVVGTSLKDCLMVDFFPRSYLNENIAEKDYINYKDNNCKKFKRLKKWKDVFNFIDKENNNTKIYSKLSNMTAFSWDNVGFTFNNKPSVMHISKIKPLKQIKFENTYFNTMNDYDYYLKDFYGDYTHLPAVIEFSKYTRTFAKIVKKFEHRDKEE